MSNTSLVLGSNWTLNKWPEHVTVIHEASVSHGLFSYRKKYVQERTCEGCAYDEPATHFAYCSGCSRDVLLEDKWVSPKIAVE